MKKQNCLNMILAAGFFLVPFQVFAEDITAPDATKPCVREIQVGASPYYDYEEYSSGANCPTGFSNNATYLQAQAAKQAAAQEAADKANQQAQQQQAAQQPQQQAQQPQQQQPQQQQQQPSSDNNNNDNSGNNNTANNDGGSGAADKNSNGSPDISSTPDSASTGAGCSGGADVGASGETTDKAGQGNCQAKQAIQQAVNSLGQLKINNASSLKSAYKSYASEWKSCVADQSAAAHACLENMSPEISSAQNGVNGLAGNMASNTATMSCDTYQQSMNTVDKGLNAYNQKCGAAKSQCANSCQSALNSLNQIKQLAQSSQCLNPQDASCTSALPSAKQAVPPAIQREQQTSDLTAMAGKQQVCDVKYTQLMQNATNGIQQAKNDAATGNRCATATNGGSSAASTNAVADARAPASTGTASSAVASSAQSASAASASPVEVASLSSTPQASATAASADAEPVTAAQKGRIVAASAGHGLDGGMATAASTSATTAPSPYSAYLPGGTKDPTANAVAAAGSDSAAAQITKPGYKSNWEKTGDRFRDLLPTFLPEQ